MTTRGGTTPPVIRSMGAARSLRIPQVRRPNVRVRVAVLALAMLVALHCGVTVALIYRTVAYVSMYALPVLSNGRDAATAALAHTAMIWGAFTLLACIGVALALYMGRGVQRSSAAPTVDLSDVRASSFVD